MEIVHDIRLTYQQVSELLSQFIEAFPSLSERVDIEQYSIKLSDNAFFILACMDRRIVGFIAYYKDYVQKVVYIPLIAVDGSFRGKGIGGTMLDVLFESNVFISFIRLEVLKNNKRAFRFYMQQGFSVIEDRKDCLLLEKVLC